MVWDCQNMTLVIPHTELVYELTITYRELWLEAIGSCVVEGHPNILMCIAS